MQEVSGQTYIVFGVILFLWELLPTSLVVVFFRVQRPNQNLVNRHAKTQQSLSNLMSANYICVFADPQAPGGMINSHSFSSRAYFFDNPRRYDSDDDLSRNGNRADRAR